MQNEGNAGDDLPILGTIAAGETLESLRAERDTLRDNYRRLMGAVIVIGGTLAVILLMFYVDHLTLREIKDLAGQKHSHPVQMGPYRYRIWVSEPEQTEDIPLSRGRDD